MRRILCILCLLFLLTACQTETPEPTPTPTAEIERLPSPTPREPTATPTEEPVLLTPTDTPVPEPALRIAYVKGEIGATDIYVANADGSDPVCVACDACDQAEPTWSPDGTQLIYQSNCGENGYDLWRVNADGTGRTQLSNTPDVDMLEPDWSHNGERVVYRLRDHGAGRNTNGLLMIMNSNATSVGSLGIEGRAPVWSPDGEMILYMQERDGDWELYTYDLLSDTAYAFSNCTNSCRWPDWSPDGSQIVFHDTVAVGSFEVNAIWTSSATSWQAQYVTDGAHAGRPSWSATGVIAFNSDNGIEVANIDGSDRHVIIEGAENWAPVWSR